MHRTDDEKSEIVLNHDFDWGGDVYIAWYGEGTQIRDRVRHVCTCEGHNLRVGRFTLLTGAEPPLNVITRAVALAVEGHLRNKLSSFYENAFYIDQEKL